MNQWSNHEILGSRVIWSDSDHLWRIIKLLRMIIVLILSIIGPISALYECDDGKEIITDVNLRCNGNIDCDDGWGDQFFYIQILEAQKSHLEMLKWSTFLKIRRRVLFAMLARPIWVLGERHKSVCFWITSLRWLWDLWQWRRRIRVSRSMYWASKLLVPWNQLLH